MTPTPAEKVRARHAELAAKFPADLRPAIAAYFDRDGDPETAETVRNCITDNPEAKVTGDYDGVCCEQCTGYARDHLKGPSGGWLPEVYQ